MPIEPEPDESYDDFMDRCVDETGDEEACDMAWEDRAAPAGDAQDARRANRRLRIYPFR